VARQVDLLLEYRPVAIVEHRWRPVVEWWRRACAAHGRGAEPVVIRDRMRVEAAGRSNTWHAE
jgi:hypothetical protein